METERQVMPLLFVVTGTLNVLLVKWSYTMQAEGSDGKWRSFQHPVLLTALMFLGELLCFVVYKLAFFVLKRRGDGSENYNFLTRGERNFSPLTLLLPTLFDAFASVLLFTGLYLTYVSSFQMIRGTAIIFAGLFGTIYLNQALCARHWMAIFTISCGVIVILSIDVQRVYYDTVTLPDADSNSVLTGNLLVLCAQVFHAAQLVYSEKHLKALDIPTMQAVGWQGLFGLAITTLIAICANFIPTQVPFNDNSRSVYDDFGDVFVQLRTQPWLFGSLGGFVLCCACYNFVALSVVKFSSTANLILADGLRALFIWLSALLLNWEVLNLITLMGFIILEMGAIAYRNAIFLDWYRSIIARVARNRYVDLSVDQDNERGVPQSRPADII